MPTTTSSINPMIYTKLQEKIEKVQNEILKNKMCNKLLREIIYLYSEVIKS